MNTKILQGDCLEVLQGMDSESVDMCITSPPYWGLRDYGEDGQLGLEPTYQEYIDKLIAIFDEVRRVLKDTGTCWVNLGDTYSTISGTMGNDKYVQPKYVVANDVMNFKQPKTDLQSKSLIGIPERFVIAMTDAGWIRRNTIIWHKPNCMPSSAADRFTVDFEYLYFFTKNTKYWFEQQFEEYDSPLDRWGGNHKRGICVSKYSENSGIAVPERDRNMRPNEQGRNKRCVWKIPTQSYSDAHFATYPEELVYTPIKAGCPKGGTVLDPFMGSGTTLKVARGTGRNGIGIELNPEYIELAKKRIDIEQGRLF